MSLLLPTFLNRLANPGIKTVLLCGCGGGFDFVHGMMLYPELMRMGKSVVISSYSFGLPEKIGGHAPTAFDVDGAIAKKVTARSKPPDYYCPEVHLCAFLDEKYPDESPHSVYACYARAFAVPQLKALYTQLIAEHNIDAVILMDGGSDSLMRGDEEGLGDPVEDAVSVATVAQLDGLKLRLLISTGMGADRFNHVSDAATLRAVAELTESGGFMGSVSIEPQGDALQFYRSCIEHIYSHQQFRSVIAGMILSSAAGHYGGTSVPPLLVERLKPGGFHLWPLMPMLWAFDAGKVAARSLISDWIADCHTPRQCAAAIARGRAQIEIRPVENLPRHEDMRFDLGV
ncbi:MAG: DUF1152 domain-containing protein [Chloroflexota bacterium]